MADVLADPEIEVVLHAGRQDVAMLRRKWETDVTNVFDTQVAAGFAGFSAQADPRRCSHDALRSGSRSPRASPAGTPGR